VGGEFHASVALTPGRRCRYPSNSRIGGLQGWSVSFGEETVLFPISGIERRLLCLQFVAWSLYWPNCLRFWKLKESYVEIALAVNVFGVQREDFVPNPRWNNFTKLSVYLRSYMEINFECDLLCLKDITACTRLSWPSREWLPLSVNLFLTSVSRPIVWKVLSSSFSHSV